MSGQDVGFRVVWNTAFMRYTGNLAAIVISAWLLRCVPLALTMPRVINAWKTLAKPVEPQEVQAVFGVRGILTKLQPAFPNRENILPEDPISGVFRDTLICLSP